MKFIPRFLTPRRIAFAFLFIFAAQVTSVFIERNAEESTSNEFEAVPYETIRVTDLRFQVYRYRFLSQQSEEFLLGRKPTAINRWVHDSTKLLQGFYDAASIDERRIFANSLLKNMELWLYFESVSSPDIYNNCRQIRLLVPIEAVAKSIHDLKLAAQGSTVAREVAYSGSLKKLRSVLHSYEQGLINSNSLAARLDNALADLQDAGLANDAVSSGLDQIENAMLDFQIAQSWQHLLPENCDNAVLEGSEIRSSQ